MMLMPWFSLLFLPHFFTLVQPLDCSDNEYGWPLHDPKRCCKICTPGYYMVARCDPSGGEDTKCKECERRSYMDRPNIELDCKRCTVCSKENMVSLHTCAKDQDSKCGCKSQYRCNNDRCDFCEKIPPTTTPAPTPAPTTTTPAPTPPPPTATTTAAAVTISTKNNGQTSPNRESVWISLSLCCACVCILLTCFILISRHTSACGRLMLASADVFWLSKKGSAKSSQCTEDEEVPMPIQEVCDKTEWEEKV